MKHWIKTLILSSCALCAITSRAKVKLPAVFSDNMILQQNKPIPVWGQADRGETVEVSFGGQTRRAKADKQGNWAVSLEARAYGGPYEIRVKGKNNELTLKNVLIGEVWLCSGQSNMEWTVKNVKNADVEISLANFPQIRAFNVTKAIGTNPKTDLEGSWQECSPNSVASFSAVGYFFALNLYKSLNIPIGIINSSWGGTDIETWISEPAFAQLPQQFGKRYKGQKVTDLEQFINENKVRKEAFQQAMNNDPGTAANWQAPATDINSWPQMKVPQLWENVIGNADGIVWYALDVTLSKDEAGKAAVLQLGTIDDNDLTWVNGQPVGHTEGYAAKREYSIPKDLLVEGKNHIMVKIIDFYGGGGFYGSPDEMTLEVNGKKHPLAGDWHYKPSVLNTQFNYVEASPNMQPSLLFNGMISPLTRFPIAGAIWYQGENNVGQAYDYLTLFPTLIRDWRKQWNSDFPFYWVQLANYLAKDKDPVQSAWAELRDAQNQTLALPNTGQAVIADIGEGDNIHPRNKQDVGRRLALAALNKTYGKSDLIYSGPTFHSMEIRGSKVVISYDNVGGGLTTSNKYGYVEGFAIAGKDQQFVWAKAYIDGDKVVVYSDKVTEPVAVRYAWANNPDINLFNKEQLPAAPFRTDSWRWSTQY